MATITFKGRPIQTVGELPAVGSAAPDFCLTNGSLEDVTLATYAGKKKILSIVPSLDTGICAMSAERFDQDVAALDNVVLLNISADLPFAAGRFCESKSLKNIVSLSTFRAPTFADDYGVRITEGPLAGLTSRAVVILDESNQVIYTEQVPEIAQEPNYEAALAAVK
jgi:thioredoxin-dependent peroxiredoxin